MKITIVGAENRLPGSWTGPRIWWGVNSLGASRGESRSSVSPLPKTANRMVGSARPGLEVEAEAARYGHERERPQRPRTKQDRGERKGDSLVPGRQAQQQQQQVTRKSVSEESDSFLGFDRPSVPGGKPAVFLDRDGTIIEHVHYLSEVEQVRLLPGAAEAIGRLRAAGFACVVVTNQSAVGRGFITEEQLGLIHDEMNRQLAAAGTAVDAIEFCPQTPGSNDKSQVEHLDRKPGPGMLFRATSALGLDLDVSWMIGDMLSDVLAGVNAGCRGSILVETGKGLDEADKAKAASTDFHMTEDLTAAADLILETHALASGN